MVLFAKFRRLIRVLKKYTLKFIFRPWKGVGAGFGCRILFGFAAFQDKFHGARGARHKAGGASPWAELAGEALCLRRIRLFFGDAVQNNSRDGKAEAEAEEEEGYGVIL